MRRVKIALAGLALALATTACNLPNANGRPPAPKPAPECAVARIYPPINACPR